MQIQSQFIERRIYSLELRHKICKEHIIDGLKMADLVRKYELSCHSLIHAWLRKLGYLPGVNRRTGVSYLRFENEDSLKTKSTNTKILTEEQKQIVLLRKELEDARLLAEGYRRVIEIAEAELKIPIRKKPNTR
jgi:transposase-like protein